MLGFALLLGSLVLLSCGKDNEKAQAANAGIKIGHEAATARIIFVELGSVNCIPCKAMQPVMKSIEQKYGAQVRMVFHDVWTPAGQKYGRTFGIRLIPTQVFLDAGGAEIMRHEGFFPEAEIDRFLQSQGLKIRQGSGGTGDDF